MLNRLLLFIGCAFVILCVDAQVRPPNYSPDSIPETSFTCEDKITGGYYADIEAECQLFHVCVQVSEFEFQDFRFLCPNDTVFDQQNLVCTNWFEVDCRQSVQFFANDFGFKETTEASYASGDTYNDAYEYYEYEEEEDTTEKHRFLVNSSPAFLNEGNRGAGGERAKGFANNNDGSPRRRHPTSTTAIPLGITKSTRRPPRVKSNERLKPKKKIKNKIRFRDPFRNPPKKRAGNKKPRVKSNLKLSGKSRSSLLKRNRKVDNTNGVKFAKKKKFSNDDDGPEVRPDGRPPRVKSDRRRQNFKPTHQSDFNPTTTIEPVRKDAELFVPTSRTTSLLLQSTSAPPISLVSTPQTAFDETPRHTFFSPTSRTSSAPAFVTTASSIPSSSPNFIPFITTTPNPFIPTRDLQNATPNPATRFRTRPPGSRPRVKSNFFQKEQFSIPPSLFTTTLSPIPQFIDEIDEYEDTSRSSIQQGGRNRINEIEDDHNSFISESPISAIYEDDFETTNTNSERIFTTRDRIVDGELDRSEIEGQYDFISRTTERDVSLITNSLDANEYNNEDAYFTNEIDDDVTKPDFTVTTEAPPFWTTRRPRVKSDIQARTRNKVFNKDNRPKSECKNPFDCPSFEGKRDHKQPRVKANLRARSRNFHFRHKLGVRTKPLVNQKFKSSFRGQRRIIPKEAPSNNDLPQEPVSDSPPLLTTLSPPTESLPVHSTATPFIDRTRFPPKRRPQTSSNLFVSQQSTTQLSSIPTEFLPTLPPPTTQDFPLTSKQSSKPNKSKFFRSRKPFTKIPTTSPTTIFDYEVASSTTVTSINVRPSTKRRPLVRQPRPPFSSFLKNRNRLRARVEDTTSSQTVTSTPSSVQNIFPTIQPSSTATDGTRKPVVSTEPTLDDISTLNLIQDAITKETFAPTIRTETTTPKHTSTTPQQPITLPEGEEQDILDINDIIVATEPTTRKPRVKSNLRLLSRNRSEGRKDRKISVTRNFFKNLFKSRSKPNKLFPVTTTTTVKPTTTTQFTPTDDVTGNVFDIFSENESSTSQPILDNEIEVSPFPGDFPASIRPDGKAPRVKSNLRARYPTKNRSSKKVPVPSNNKFFKPNRFTTESAIVINNGDEPLVRPDGLKPRVKSNILAKTRSEGFRHSTRIEPTSLPKFASTTEEESPTTTTTESISPTTTTRNNKLTSQFLQNFLAKHKNKSGKRTFLTTKEAIDSTTTTTTIGPLPPELGLLPLFNTRAVSYSETLRTVDPSTNALFFEPTTTKSPSSTIV